MRLSFIITLASAAAAAALLNPYQETELYERDLPSLEARSYDIFARDSEAPFDDFQGLSKREAYHVQDLVARHEDLIDLLRRAGTDRAAPVCSRCHQRTAIKNSVLCGACMSALKTVYDPQPIKPKQAHGH
ncbi:hypothetical protein MMC32_004625 [Xylographa parallela]|nr:hypothetical protein [Xylographa parallela]